MPVCTFCKHNYEYPRGTTVVQKDGNAKYYCSSKCRKNSEMGRDNKKVKWVRKSELVKIDKAKKDEARKKLMEEKKAEIEARKAKKASKKKK
jgi:large subunit ribosomal protein L24e